MSTIIKPFLDNEEFREQNPDALQIPPKGYGISVDTWRQFVAQKTSEEARVTLFFIFSSKWVEYRTI